MYILHGTWVPETIPPGGDDFVQGGSFCLWVETDQPIEFGSASAAAVSPPGTPRQTPQKAPRKTRQRSPAPLQTSQLPRHDRQLPQSELSAFLAESFGPGAPVQSRLKSAIEPRYFWLPSGDSAPFPSPELARWLDLEPAIAPAAQDSFRWQAWQIDCYCDPTPDWLQRLLELNFWAQSNPEEVQLGADLQFWLRFSRVLRDVLLKDQYIPALCYRVLKPKAKQKQYAIYHHWEWVSSPYETAIAQAAEAMPWACATGFDQPPVCAPIAPQFRDRPSLLRHCSEVALTQAIRHTDLPQGVLKQIEDSLIHRCWQDTRPMMTTVAPTTLETFQHWQHWRDRIVATQTALSFNLYFVLQNPPDAEGDWQLLLQVSPRQDPSLQIPLAEYWRQRGPQQVLLRQQLGQDFEQQLLLNLGYAARIYPKLWEALATDQPVGVAMDLEAALEFLQEAAWILKDAGYHVVVPAWWTPEGRRRVKLKLRAPSSSQSSGQSSGSGEAAKAYFSATKLQDYDYSLSIGDEPVSQAEWEQLVASKASLVHFRGQWMELDPDKMRELLEFWQQSQGATSELGLLDLLRLEAEHQGDVELDFGRDRALATMLTQLRNKQQLTAIADPKTLQGQLRDYQRRGVSWLSYLDSLGLNGCLADDMGLGKTVQVIARLLQEREQQAASPCRPTLLIAPTSVVGNWLREIAKFGPGLKAFVHHGSDRTKSTADFQQTCQGLDVVITSFTLARTDSKLLQAIPWQRIVLDEAQNIKNPKAAQTKAILKLQASHRLALTGTPVENRLLDLWSIFNFLNPGYLGKENQFRRNFERPIQRYGDSDKAAVLKQLVEPFILRRLKTDTRIIQDLPAKVEQKVYCHLTREQASLYEGVVREISGQLKAAEGIQRRGLILASLTKLKQICNHPAQFLHDRSEFSTARSHKFERLAAMAAEVLAEGDSLLIFTQFREMGEALERYLRQSCYYNTYFLHGGTSQPQRDRTVAEFQDPATEPSVFVLSLKAGGVGITLTKANHVFHFDRWWNPAVEDQASDRAFRIGQTKTVFVHKFVATGTLEERIDELIEDKKKLSETVVGNDESWLTALDTESFKQLIALNRSAVLD